MRSYLLLVALLLTSCGVANIPAPVMAAGVTPLPTATATETPVPPPTIDNNATIVAYQNEAIQARQTAVEAIAANAAVTAQHEQILQDQLILTSQSEYINFQMAGWTATAAPTSIALTSTAQLVILGNQTMQASQMTATAQAPTLVVAMAQSRNVVENIKTDYILSIVGKLVMMFFVIVLAVFLIWKMRTVTPAQIMNNLQQEADNEDDYKPVEAEVVSYNPRRMEQRFAQVLLAMHELEPDDKAVNLLETFWIVRGARDKFQSRAEFLEVRDDWASDENGILKRVDPTVPNSTFYVAKWDEVKLIANGERL